MPTFQVLVLSEPREGKEDEFNEWYENTHLDEVIATTGWGRAQRFRLSETVGAECPLPYMAAYEAEAGSAQEVLDTLNSTRDGRQQSAALNKRTAGVWVYEATGPEHSS
ncbi:MAG: hypothetical protein GKR90_16140 [Pseudomonadales bacterium]|nr:hypothetical protein [Pseudomonadales bacterium]